MMADVPPERERRIRQRQTVRLIVWLALLGILVLFALLNTEDARVDWLFGEEEAPLFVVIAVAAVIGALAGAIAAWRQKD
jgi:uncharacterized integral membrane protein